MTKRKPFRLCERGGQPRRYACYELLQDEVPAYVGWGPLPCPWGSLWNFRQYLPGPMGIWLKYLDKVPNRGWWHFGKNGPISRRAAESLVADRVQELRALGIDPIYNRQPHKGGRGRGRPVIRIWSDGRTDSFRSVSAAARAAGLSRRSLLQLLDSATVDGQGALWAAI